MNEAVFISDLHLNPDCSDITEQFLNFCDWAVDNTKSIYILGDFFHLWIGDDDKSSWILPIKQALMKLSRKGIFVYYMGGNRDFLLGKRFCQSSQMTYLSDATLLKWGDHTIALTHGDRLCTKDKLHQVFYKITRNPFFRLLFTKLPFVFRRSLAQRIRLRSQQNKSNQRVVGYVTIAGMKKFAKRYPCNMVIHGHTHQPALHHHVLDEMVLKRYVLSDWDDNIVILCYHKAKGFYFYHV